MMRLLLTSALLLFSVQISSERGLERKAPLIQKEVVCKKIRTSELISDMDLLQTNFRKKAQKLIDSCKSVGIELRVIETYRTYKRQDKLFNQKRRVTTLRGGQSNHQHGLAIDVVPVTNGKDCWNNYKLWNRIGLIGESLGMYWGGRFKRFYDAPHFEAKSTEVSCNRKKRQEAQELALKWKEEETL